MAVFFVRMGWLKSVANLDFNATIEQVLMRESPEEETTRERKGFYLETTRDGGIQAYTMLLQLIPSFPIAIFIEIVNIFIP